MLTLSLLTLSSNLHFIWPFVIVSLPHCVVSPPKIGVSWNVVGARSNSLLCLLQIFASAPPISLTNQEILYIYCIFFCVSIIFTGRRGGNCIRYRHRSSYQRKEKLVQGKLFAGSRHVCWDYFQALPLGARMNAVILAGPGLVLRSPVTGQMVTNVFLTACRG